MRIAIFGGGSIGRRHRANAQALRFQDVCFFDADQNRGTDPKHFKPEFWDAVMVCTPASTHEAVAEQLLGSGYAGPLFVEKPLALRSAAAIFMRWPHPVTMVGYNLRFHASIEFLRRCYPTSGEFSLDCDSRLWPGAGYAGLLEECSHEIDLALHLGARPSVEGSTHLTAHSADFRLGPTWGIHLNDRADRYCRQWVVGGKTSGTSFVFRDPAALGADMYVAELVHFLESVRLGRPTRTPFAEGLRVMEICERVKERAS